MTVNPVDWAYERHSQSSHPRREGLWDKENLENMLHLNALKRKNIPGMWNARPIVVCYVYCPVGRIGCVYCNRFLGDDDPRLFPINSEIWAWTGTREPEKVDSEESNRERERGREGESSQTVSPIEARRLPLLMSCPLVALMSPKTAIRLRSKS